MSKSKAENSFNLSKFLPESEQEATQMKWIQREFDRWDTDHSGAIDEQEFANIFGTEKEPYCIPYAEKLFQWFDMDASGEIDFREFVFGMSQLPIPTATNAPVKFLFQLYAVNMMARKEDLYGIVQDSAGTDRKTRGGVSVNGALHAIASLPKERLNYKDLESIMVDHENAFSPLLVLWDVVGKCVAPCKAVKKGMMNNVWLKDYFSDLENKLKKQTNPARSIDELMKQNRKPEAKAKLQKGMKTVLASVRMSMMLGGKGASGVDLSKLKAAASAPKKESVYQVKAPSYCADETSSFQAIRTNKSGEKGAVRKNNTSVWGDASVVGGSRPKKSGSQEMLASPSMRGGSSSESVPRARSPVKRPTMSRDDAGGSSGRFGSDHFGSGGSGSGSGSGSGGRAPPGAAAPLSKSKWSFVKKQVKPAALASKLFGMGGGGGEGGGGGRSPFGKSPSGKHKT